VTTLARAVNDNFVVAQRLWTQSDPILARRYGLANATRAGGRLLQRGVVP